MKDCVVVKTLSKTKYYLTVWKEQGTGRIHRSRLKLRFQIFSDVRDTVVDERNTMKIVKN